MIQPTIRCANRECECSVSMAAAMRVGTRLYCSFHCANGYSECGVARSGRRTAPRTSGTSPYPHAKAG